MLKFRTVNILFAVTLLALIAVDWSYDLHVVWYWIVLFLYLGIVTYGSAVLSAQFFLPVIYRANGESNSVALTFDDGPIAGKTEEILRILSAHNVHAAFFCIGNRVDTNPELTKRIHDAGHVIGNHSYWHRATFDLQSAPMIRNELVNTDNAIF